MKGLAALVLASKVRIAKLYYKLAKQKETNLPEQQIILFTIANHIIYWVTFRLWEKKVIITFVISIGIILK